VLPNNFNIGGGSTTQCSSGALICVGISPFSNQQNHQSDSQFRYDGSRVSGKHQWHFGAGFDRISLGRFAPLSATVPVLSDQSSVPLPAGLGGSNGLAIDPASYPVQWAYLSNGQGFQSEKSAFGLSGRRTGGLAGQGGEPFGLSSRRGLGGHGGQGGERFASGGAGAVR